MMVSKLVVYNLTGLFEGIIFPTIPSRKYSGEFPLASVLVSAFIPSRN